MGNLRARSQFSVLLLGKTSATHGSLGKPIYAQTGRAADSSDDLSVISIVRVVSGGGLLTPIFTRISPEGNTAITPGLDILYRITWENAYREVPAAQLDVAGSGFEISVRDSAGSVVKDADGNELRYTSHTGDSRYTFKAPATPGTYTIRAVAQLSRSTGDLHPIQTDANNETNVVTFTVTQGKPTTPDAPSDSPSSGPSSRGGGGGCVLAPGLAGFVMLAALIYLRKR